MIRETCDCGWTASKPNPECERCRLAHFFRATVRMRNAQEAYFNGRTGKQLEEAKNAERYVDKLIARLNEIQPSLFDEDSPG